MASPVRMLQFACKRPQIFSIVFDQPSCPEHIAMLDAPFPSSLLSCPHLGCVGAGFTYPLTSWQRTRAWARRRGWRQRMTGLGKRGKCQLGAARLPGLPGRRLGCSSSAAGASKMPHIVHSHHYEDGTHRDFAVGDGVVAGRVPKNTAVGDARQTPVRQRPREQALLTHPLPSLSTTRVFLSRCLQNTI
jgi:hypothetical protein